MLHVFTTETLLSPTESYIQLTGCFYQVLFLMRTLMRLSTKLTNVSRTWLSLLPSRTLPSFGNCEGGEFTLFVHRHIFQLSTAQLKGPFTMFAPTDAAFARIPSDTLASLASDLKTLTSVLNYHVIQDYILTPLVNGVRNETTLEGGIISIQRTPSGLLINGVAHTLPSQSDLVVNNGVIQPIDTVLLQIFHPATETLTQIIVREDHRFKDLAVAFLLVNLLTTLSSGDYTVFAPVDSAFVKYKDNLLSFDAPNAPTIYTKVMQYHIVRGGRTASQLYHGQSLTTMEGMPLHVTKDASGMKINNVTVIEADIRATNGVLHVINDILIPPDFRG